MTELNAVDSNKDKASIPEKATSPLEEKLVADTKIASELPIPDKNAFWDLSDNTKMAKKKRGLRAIFKRKALTEEELSQLRENVEKAPGRAKVKLQELMKENASNADLKMLYAICSYRMIMNSSNRKGALEGLKGATKDAANALLADGISLYNCEKFFEIYFEYINKLKRFQISTYKALDETVRQKALKKELESVIKMSDILIDEKNRVHKVLNQIKGRFKSSSYNIPWEFADIKLAGKKMEQNDLRYQCGPAEAHQLIVYISALLDLFARIPVLHPLVDTLLQLIPEGSTSLTLRKASIQATRAFGKLALLLIEGDMDRIRTLARQIYKTSFENLQPILNHHVKQGFEADPYFSISRITIMTFGLFKAEEQAEMLQTSAKAIKRLIKLDMSKSKAFAQTAGKLEYKLSSLLAETGKSSAI